MKRFLGRISKQGMHGVPTPLAWSDCRVCWRGHVSNRNEILAEARRRGLPAEQGTTDGALFALAYRCWGEGLQAHVLGQYAVAIFDERNRTLLLTHDALGLLPLFYHTTAEGMCFGSHLDDLADDLGVNKLDEEYFAEYLATRMARGERTPYWNLRRLAPGCSLVWQSGRLVKKRTWSLTEVHPRDIRESDVVEQLRELVHAGVAGALPAMGSVWTELSGGLDSSTVACVASRLGARDLAAVSLVYPRHRRADESAWIRVMLDAYSMPWHVVDGEAVLPYSELPGDRWDEPGLAMINGGWRRKQAELLRTHGVDTLLTGQGGDLVFLGPGTPPLLLADLARSWQPRRLAAELRRWRRADRQQRSWSYWLVHQVFRPLMRSIRGRSVLDCDTSEVSPWLRADFVRRWQIGERKRALGSDHGAFDSVAAQWFGERLNSTCALAASLNQAPVDFEFRHPLLHRPLVEFMYALPWERKLDPDMDRFLQRQAMQGLLPEAIRRRRGKATFDQPSFEGLRRGRNWLDALTHNPRLVERGIVDAEGWREAVARARMGSTHCLPQFDAAVTLEIWLRQFERSRVPKKRSERGRNTHQYQWV
jgi:asparagine synthase (glutamine-hydrolysing)